MRMHAQHDAVALADVPQEPLDLIGIHVRGGHLDGGRKVQDGAALWSGLPHGVHRIADLNREIELGPREALRAVLKYPFATPLPLGVLAHARSAPHRDVDDAGAVGTKHDAAL